VPEAANLPYRVTAAGEHWDVVEHLPVAVLLDNVRSLYNVGAFFRTLDAVRGMRLYLSGITAAPPHAGLAKTALGAEHSVAWDRVDDSQTLVADLQRSGVQVAAVETRTDAIDLFDWQPAFPVCVVFGHEVDGITPALVDSCDIRVRVPMLGRKQSLNVATAGGVVLYELLRRYRLRFPGPTAGCRLPTADCRLTTDN
jgi:23S rRNA (guanosine2251-2'-O)-methyltransferase